MTYVVIRLVARCNFAGEINLPRRPHLPCGRFWADRFNPSALPCGPVGSFETRGLEMTMEWDAETRAKFVQRYEIGDLMVDAADMIDGVLIDPAAPPSSDIPNESRPMGEVMAWWRLPYIITRGIAGSCDIHCLDGGAWDRPTMIGQAATLPEAVEIAKAYRAKAHTTHVYVG